MVEPLEELTLDSLKHYTSNTLLRIYRRSIVMLGEETRNG